MYCFCGWKRGVVLYAKGSYTRNFTVLLWFWKKWNMINPQTNITKLVVMTLPNCHWKDFVIHQETLPTFHNPSVHQNLFFSPFEPSSEVITYCMECTQHSTPLQLSSNITKETHLPSCAQTMFSFYNTSKWTLFSSDHAPWKSYSCHFATPEFHKLGIYPEQIACFITNHVNITLKYYLNHSNLPTYVPRPPLKKSHFSHFLYSTPW